MQRACRPGREHVTADRSDYGQMRPAAGAPGALHQDPRSPPRIRVSVGVPQANRELR